MIVDTAKIRRICWAWLFALLMPLASNAQMKAGQIDIFMGVDFHYRDIYLNGRPFDFLINLTPGVKWNLGHRWEVAAGALVPIINQYGGDYGQVCLNNLTVSKQFAALNRLKIKASAGVFGGYRYGLDAKAMLIINKWLAITGELGVVGFIQASKTWKMSTMKEVVGMAGPVFYLHRWNTELSAKGGRYIYGDYGCEAQVMRHFKHVTVGIYGSYSEIVKENAGFKVIVMLPPYRTKRRKVNFRPASNFNITYRSEADMYSNRMYLTDPEQNERQGWFDRDLLPWGQNTMAPDFAYKNEQPADSVAGASKKKEVEER